MKLAIAASLLLFSSALLCPGALAQVPHRKNFLDQEHGRVRITNGPIVETLKSDSATIAWATNLKSDSTVRYGAKRDLLNQVQTLPSDGKSMTHRVQLKNLEPGKTYYFRVQSQSPESNHADDSKVLSFTTPAVGAQASHNEFPR